MAHKEPDRAHLPRRPGRQANEKPAVKKIESIDSYVPPDGDYTVFTVKYHDIDPLRVLVPFGEYAKLQYTVNNASKLMVSRQRQQLDKGMRKIHEVLASSMEPSGINVILDRETGDVIVLLQFPNLAPLALRLAPDSVDQLFNEIADAKASSRH